jgi:hypothetical protein
MRDTYGARFRSMTGTFRRAIAGIWRHQQEARKFTDFVWRYPNDADRVAHDLGLSVPELMHVSTVRGTWRRLLSARMSALGLDPKIIDAKRSEHARDLTRICALCDSKARCARDLRRQPGSGIWRTYCPNESTLNSLARENAVDHMLKTIGSPAHG